MKRLATMGEDRATAGLRLTTPYRDRPHRRETRPCETSISSPPAPSLGRLLLRVSAIASHDRQEQAGKLHGSPQRKLRRPIEQLQADGNQLRTQHGVGKLAQRSDRDLATLRDALHARTCDIVSASLASGTSCPECVFSLPLRTSVDTSFPNDFGVRGGYWIRLGSSVLRACRFESCSSH